MNRTIISLALTLGVTASAFASNNFTPFTSIDQAKLYCPSENALTFTASNPLPNSVGTVTGINQKTFYSYPGQVSRPKNLNQNNLITDAQFRKVDGYYGYNSNGVVTCLYSYENIFNGQYQLVMRSKW